MQAAVDHVKRNQIELQKYVPKISKSIATFTYSMKSVIGDRDDVRMITTRERDLENEVLCF